MADDWTIVSGDDSVGDKPSFLELIRSAALTTEWPPALCIDPPSEISLTED
jgi:hypothetical protein